MMAVATFKNEVTLHNSRLNMEDIHNLTHERLSMSNTEEHCLHGEVNNQQVSCSVGHAVTVTDKKT